MESRASRLLRGMMLGSVATLLAALSHSWGGGVAPGQLSLVLGAVFASAVGVIAVGRRRRTSLLRTSIGVALSQLAFHLVFSLIGTGGGVVMTAGHHPSVASIAASPGEAIERGGAAMLLAHLAAGALTVAYLRRLESLVWALIARLGGYAVRALDVRAVPATAPRTIAPVAVRAPRRPLLLTDAITRRGPPAAACA